MILEPSFDQKGVRIPNAESPGGRGNAIEPELLLHPENGAASRSAIDAVAAFIITVNVKWCFILLKRITGGSGQRP
jgi:hypothetical protein